MILTVLKAAFVILLCIPIGMVAFNLIVKLMDQYIWVNKEKKEQQAREKKALEQQKRRRGNYR